MASGRVVFDGSSSGDSRTRGHAGTGRVLGATLVVLSLVVRLDGASVVGSKHDISRPGVVYADQVCAFCHTPHRANRILNAPLWNRFLDTSKVFTVYQSATMDTVPGQPTNTYSMLCLGCHDGTIGYGTVGGVTGDDKHNLVNAPGPAQNVSANCSRCHGTIIGQPPPNFQGMDLSNDHPIAMTYPTPLQDPAFNTPPDPQTGWTNVRLYDGRVECPTCHAVHDPGHVPFLRMPNTGSQLCLMCHVK